MWKHDLLHVGLRALLDQDFVLLEAVLETAGCVDNDPVDAEEFWSQARDLLDEMIFVYTYGVDAEPEPVS